MGKEDASYVLGIVSIVFGFFSPLAALIIGIIGFNLGKGKSEMAVKGKKYSKLGIVISIIVLIITLGTSYYLYNNPSLI